MGISTDTARFEIEVEVRGEINITRRRIVKFRFSVEAKKPGWFRSARQHPQV